MTAFSFKVDTATDVPLWVQLRKRLIHLINTGYYKPGDQLPTVRGLASDLAINYNTVNKTYLSMINDGYISSTRGRGVFVCETEIAEDDETTREAAMLVRNCVKACRELGLTTEEIRLLMARRLQVEEQAGDADSSGAKGTASGLNAAGTAGGLSGAGTALLRVLEGSGGAALKTAHAQRNKRNESAL